MKINIEVSCGELIDKLTILSIKQEKITDVQKLKNITKEKSSLEIIAQKLKTTNEKEYEKFFHQLQEVNKELWDIEDKIRKLEMKKDFSEHFIQLARSVYITNDERFKIKNTINSFFHSEMKEEKEYEKYNNEN
jgi:hypothetical protein